MKRTQLDKHVDTWSKCKACPLHKTRSTVVLYRGSVPCDILFIGEAPGNSENAVGLPFIGVSGKLLDTIIYESLPSSLSYALTNTVACIPRDTNYPLEQEKFRAPTAEEIKACSTRLLEFVALAKPRAIVLVGKIASKTKALNSLKLPTLTITHPAYMLRQGGSKSVEYKRATLQLKQWSKTL